MLKSILLIIAFTCLISFDTSFGQETTQQLFPEDICGTYIYNVEPNLSNISRETHPNLKGRVLFVQSAEGKVQNNIKQRNAAESKGKFFFTRG